MSITAQALIQSAFRDLGILIPTPLQEQQALDDLLNPMLSRWSTESLLRQPLAVEESFALIPGTNVYTIGPAGMFDTVRPTRIVDAFIRTSDNLDHPVSVTLALEDFNRLANKSFQARPENLYYATEYPLGKIHFDTTPDLAYTLKLFSWKPLPTFASLTTTIVLPDEYIEPIRMNLAALLAPRNSYVLDSLYIQGAIGAQAMLRTLNSPAQPDVRHDNAIVWDLER